MERFVVTYLEANNRLDKTLSLFKSDISRSYIAKLIEEGKVLVNDKQEKSSYKVKENDVICLLDFTDKKSDIKEEDIPLDVVYEDDDIMIINKAQGMVVHPANGHYLGTLVNALMHQADSLSSINGVIRPGIVHRIDKEGKPATTHFQVIERFNDHTLVKCQLVSGRTHQIRVHMSAINHPVEGDPLYAGRNYDKLYKNGQLLTAYKLKLIHPSSKKEMVFEIDLPDYFKEVLDKLR